MIFLWQAKAQVINSDLTNSGGPLFILCDGDREEGTDVKDEQGACLTADKESKLETWAAGTEIWYKQNEADGLFAYLKGMDLLLSATFGKSFVTEKDAMPSGTSSAAEEDTIEMVNIIAVIIPSPASILDNTKGNVNIAGKFTREDETYGMNSDVVKGIKGFGSIGFQNASNYAMMAGEDSLIDPVSQGTGQPWIDSWKNSTSDLLSIYMRMGEGYPYFAAIIGDFHTV